MEKPPFQDPKNQSPINIKLSKRSKVFVTLCAFLFVLLVGFQNCAKKITQNRVNTTMTIVQTTATTGSSTTSSTTTSSIASLTKLDVGGDHGCVIFSDNQVKCWGANDKGQLGQDSNTNIGDDSGEIAALGYVDLGSENGTKLTAKAITTGRKHTCAILNNDKVKCWGCNKFGQLGQDNSGNKENIGDESGEMAALGYVNLGTEDETDNGAGLTAKAIIATGGHHTCAILSNNKLKCWGRNNKGQLGLETTTDVGANDSEMGNSLSYISLGTEDGTNNGTELTVKAITTGKEHTCAILNNNKVKCWGFNEKGQLGLDNSAADVGGNAGEMGNSLSYINLGTEDGTNNGTELTAKAITATGANHTCAILKNNDKVKCWGFNEKGQLGVGSIANVGVNSNEMGNSLPYVELGTTDGTDNGTELTAKAITTGQDHTCAILSNDKLKCWGLNEKGQLGLGSNAPYIGGSNNEMGNNLSAVQLETDHRPVSAARAGNQHTCAVYSDSNSVNKLKCWGANDEGQLGQGNTDPAGHDKQVHTIKSIDF